MKEHSPLALSYYPNSSEFLAAATARNSGSARYKVRGVSQAAHYRPSVPTFPAITKAPIGIRSGTERDEAGTSRKDPLARARAHLVASALSSRSTSARDKDIKRNGRS